MRYQHSKIMMIPVARLEEVNAALHAAGLGPNMFVPRIYSKNAKDNDSAIAAVCDGRFTTIQLNRIRAVIAAKGSQVTEDDSRKEETDRLARIAKDRGYGRVKPVKKEKSR